MDTVPNVLSPTWSNGRCQAYGLAKILDKYLMAKYVREDFGKYRTWTHFLGFSDHRAIVLQIDLDKSTTDYPFKFNPIWMEDHNLCAFVKEKWAMFSEAHYSYVRGAAEQVVQAKN